MGIALTILFYDHGFIQQVIDVLGEAAKRRIADGQKTGILEIAEFLERFMDRFHHGKEEKFLFPVVARSSPSLMPGIQELISDHQRSRDLLKAMVSEMREGGSAGKLYELSRMLAEHMTAHIAKEEEIIFPEIGKDLTPEDDQRINREFNNFTVGLFYKFFEEAANRIQNDILGPGFYESRPDRSS
jgi:hemerythrin-like domain-containing protein